MSTLVIKRRDGSDLPRRTRIRVVTHPDGFRTWKLLATKSGMVELDPGCYNIVRVKSTKNTRGKFVCFKEVNVIYHDITKEQLAKIENRDVGHFKAIKSPDGNRWRCTWAGCDVTDLTSPIAAKVHVLEEHFAEKPLAGPPEPAPAPEPEPSTDESEKLAETVHPEQRRQVRKPPPKPPAGARTRNTNGG